jgi:hypothetical protein
MKKQIFVIIILLCIQQPLLYSEDYQIQYFKSKKKKHLPFSDYIPKVRLHWNTVPHYLEDYYELYGMKQYYNVNSLRKNIERLKTALNSKFRHPSNALVKVESEQEYLKYRNLMFMHINLLIMRNYMRLASRYNKRKLYFYSTDYATEIYESLGIADKFFREAIPYWKKAENYAKRSSRIKITTDLPFIESERYSIIQKELDYQKIINSHLKKISRKRKRLTENMASSK